MADEKKAPDKKTSDKKAPTAGPFNKNHYQEVLFVVIPGLFILSYIIDRLSAYFHSAGGSTSSPFWQKVFSWAVSFWYNWIAFATILTGAAIVLAVYSFLRLWEIRKEEFKIFGVPPKDEFLEMDVPNTKEKDRWDKIIEHAYSNNPAQWRVAIIEADNMLEEMLRAAGYTGDGVGDLLKSVEPSSMLTLDAAWEGHKIRNRIAHAGQDFDLTERETRRVIKLFESVFKEFGLV